MKHKDFDINGSSRSNQRAKRRKTNLVLNSLIAIVILLIIIVSFSIFFGSSEKASSTNDNEKIESTETNKVNQDASSENNKNDDSENVTVDENTEDSDLSVESESAELDSESESDDTSTEATDTDNVVTEESGSDPNVKSTITNPDWQPIGTTQTGEHASIYDENSTDWQEMIKAISYGTGLDQNNMTVWFLGNNGENQSVGTVSSKDQSVNYRVFIEWVDGQGWKPTKVEELIDNTQR